MDEINQALNKAEIEYGISQKVRVATEMVNELGKLRVELSEFGYEIPELIYVEPLGKPTSYRGRRFIDRVSEIEEQLEKEGE